MRYKISLVVAILLIAVLATGCPNRTSPSKNPNQNQSQNKPRPEQPETARKTEPNPARTPYDAALKPAAAEKTVTVNLEAVEKTMEIAPGVQYNAWTYNGNIPGPFLRVKEGTEVRFTLTNLKGNKFPHSVDFHTIQGNPQVYYKSVSPGEKLETTWTARKPGIYMYHCGTPPVWQHIANGMYGAIIVDPAKGWTPAREYAFVQSEFYTTGAGTKSLDVAKFNAGNPDYTVFNGYATQYLDNPLPAKAGEKVRLFVLNAGPSRFSAFHVIGEIFDRVYHLSDLRSDPARDIQTDVVPPGGGAVYELVFDQAGLYPFLSHSMVDLGKGLVGAIKVE